MGDSIFLCRIEEHSCVPIMCSKWVCVKKNDPKFHAWEVSRVSHSSVWLSVPPFTSYVASDRTVTTPRCLFSLSPRIQLYCCFSNKTSQVCDFQGCVEEKWDTTPKIMFSGLRICPESMAAQTKSRTWFPRTYFLPGLWQKVLAHVTQSTPKATAGIRPLEVRTFVEVTRWPWECSGLVRAQLRSKETH